jgi:outer membrane protein assembly factor BamB
MSRRLIFACLVLTFLGPAAKGQVPVSRDLLPTRTALARLGLERHWMAVVPLVGTERLLGISISSGLLFAQTTQGNFHVYDAESGRHYWSAALGPDIRAARPASANSTTVFVTNSNYLYALDRQTGRQVWQVNLGIQPSSSTSCDEEIVMVGLSSGLLRAFTIHESKDKDPTTHRALPGGSFAFNWQTNGPMTSRPLPAGRLVAFAGHDGRAYVAMMKPPTMLYRIATGGEIPAPISSHGTRTLLVPSADMNVYAVDLFTAKMLWVLPTGAPVLQEPLVADNDIYIVNAAGILSSVDVVSGQVRWSTSTQGGRLISVSGTRVYLESHDDDLFIIDRGTGRMVASPADTFVRAGLNLRSYTLGPTNRLDDRLCFATSSGLIICLREIGQPQPRLLRDPKEKPFGHIPPEGIDTNPHPAPEAAPAEGAPAEGAAAPEPK